MPLGTTLLPPDLSPNFIHDKQIPQRVCSNGMSRLYRGICGLFYDCLPIQVFDNYAVTVMIGDDPYTLGLFDTAGEQPQFLFAHWLFVDYAPSRKF